MSDREFGIETRCLHAGQMPDAATSSRAVPLYQTASYVFDNSDHAASLSGRRSCISCYWFRNGGADGSAADNPRIR